MLMVVAGAYAALAEPFEFVSAEETDAHRVAAIVSGGLTRPLSLRGRYWVTRQCYVAITSVYARLSPGDRRQALFDACGALADDITSEEPLNGFAFLVSALIAAENGNVVAFNSAMAEARRTAPNEGWLSQLRVAVGEQYYASFDEPGRKRHNADLAVTAATRLGLPQIATAFVANPGRREEITAVVETLAPSLQERFLTAVQAEVARRR
jgi:hypothetical protein